MAYDRQIIFQQAQAAIRDHNLFFIEDVVAFLPCDRATYYRLFQQDCDECDTLKKMQGFPSGTYWKYDKPRKCDLHPTMKPVALVENCLKDGTIKGGIVLDVFGGSGTTIIACERQDRCARLMEIDPHYCDVIIARWEKMTGEKAIKI